MKAWICATALREAVGGVRLAACLSPLSGADVPFAAVCRTAGWRAFAGMRLACFSLLAGGLASQTAAQPPGPLCPEGVFTAAVVESPEDLARALERLAPLAQACDARDDFHAWRGALLLGAGNFADAVLALEKALLLNPDLAGAQLDYAQALARVGQLSGARELVQQVAERPDIEPALRAWLGEEAGRTSGGNPGLRLTWSGMLQGSIGRETNLVSASHTRELTLYLLGGPVQVQLADNQRPQAGMAFRLSGAVQAVADPGFGALRFSIFAQQRRAEAAQVPDQQFARLELAYSHPLGEGQFQWLMARQKLHQAELYAVDDLTTSVGYAPDAAVGPCKGAAALGRSDQRYAQAENMAGRYQFGRVELRCTLAGDWRIGRTAGSDQPVVADRPGGEKRRADVYLRYERLLEMPLALRSGGASPVTLSAWARSGYSRDASVYSELLGSAPIRTRRHDIGFGLWWRFAGQWDVGLDVERSAQTSTNPLLRIDNVSIYTSVRWQVR